MAIHSSIASLVIAADLDAERWWIFTASQDWPKLQERRKNASKTTFLFKRSENSTPSTFFSSFFFIEKKSISIPRPTDAPSAAQHKHSGWTSQAVVFVCVHNEARSESERKKRRKLKKG